MKIGIDVDGVLRDIVSPLLRAWFRKTGISKRIEDITDWHIHRFLEIEKVGMTPDDFYTWWFDNFAVYEAALPIEGGIEYVPKIANEHVLFVATSQPSSMARFQTLAWLEHYFPNCWAGIYFGADKGILELDVMIDDAWKNLDASSTWRALLFDQPWNRHIYGFERVRSWQEVFFLFNG